MVQKNETPRLRSKLVGVSLIALSAAMLTACGGGGRSDNSGATVVNNGSGDTGKGGGTSGGNSNSDSDGGKQPAGQASISGKLTYDLVPTATTPKDDGTLDARLDYAHIQRKPVRHALVEVLSETGSTVLGSTFSDENGAYSVSVPAGTRAYVRVSAQASEGPENTPAYSLSVRDNTSLVFAIIPALAPIYSIRSSAFTNEANGTIVDLNAASGWTGSGYGQTRAAAPFAILDEIVSAGKKVHASAPDVTLPALNVFWSANNRPTEGDPAKGFITATHYNPGAATKGMYILGAENVDTDEYDASVVVHEFGHYVEDTLSRSDSIGGRHGPGDALDMRVAFGEGWGNAFSSMMRETPIYTDTQGPQQSQAGVTMQLDRVPNDEPMTWFGEDAIGNFLYSLYASPEVGFRPLLQTMLNGEKTTQASTSVFSFATALRPTLSAAGKSTLDTALRKLGIAGGATLDEWGSSLRAAQPSHPIMPAIYPVYLPLTPDASATSCTTTIFGTGNKLGNFRHTRLTVPAAGRYKLTLSASQGGAEVKNYGVAVYQAGKEISTAASANSEFVYQLPAAGDYVADIAPMANANYDTAPSETPECISVSLQRAN